MQHFHLKYILLCPCVLCAGERPSFFGHIANSVKTIIQNVTGQAPQPTTPTSHRDFDMVTGEKSVLAEVLSPDDSDWLKHYALELKTPRAVVNDDQQVRHFEIAEAIKSYDRAKVNDLKNQLISSNRQINTLNQEIEELSKHIQELSNKIDQSKNPEHQELFEKERSVNTLSQKSIERGELAERRDQIAKEIHDHEMNLVVQLRELGQASLDSIILGHKPAKDGEATVAETILKRKSEWGTTSTQMAFLIHQKWANVTDHGQLMLPLADFLANLIVDVDIPSHLLFQLCLAQLPNLYKNIRDSIAKLEDDSQHKRSNDKSLPKIESIIDLGQDQMFNSMHLFSLALVAHYCSKHQNDDVALSVLSQINSIVCESLVYLGQVAEHHKDLATLMLPTFQHLLLSIMRVYQFLPQKQQALYQSHLADRFYDELVSNKFKFTPTQINSLAEIIESFRTKEKQNKKQVRRPKTQLFPSEPVSVFNPTRGRVEINSGDLQAETHPEAQDASDPRSRLSQADLSENQQIPSRLLTITKLKGIPSLLNDLILLRDLTTPGAENNPNCKGYIQPNSQDSLDLLNEAQSIGSKLWAHVSNMELFDIYDYISKWYTALWAFYEATGQSDKAELASFKSNSWAEMRDTAKETELRNLITDLYPLVLKNLTEKGYLGQALKTWFVKSFGASVKSGGLSTFFPTMIDVWSARLHADNFNYKNAEEFFCCMGKFATAFIAGELCKTEIAKLQQIAASSSPQQPQPDNPSGVEVDLWSFGVLMYSILTQDLVKMDKKDLIKIGKAVSSDEFYPEDEKSTKKYADDTTNRMSDWLQARVQETTNELFLQNHSKADPNGIAFLGTALTEWITLKSTSENAKKAFFDTLNSFAGLFGKKVGS